MSDTHRDHILYTELQRFRPELFQFHPRMCAGWLSDRYFPRAAAVLEHAGRDPIVTMQIFNKKGGVLAGVWEVIAMLQTQLAPGYAPEDLEIDTLLEGDRFEPWESVMHIRGPYRAFAHLETPYLGVFARRSRVATRTSAVVTAAGGKDIIFMPARHDDWRVQVPDGYAAFVGGAARVSTDGNAAWWDTRGVGTMPHALIAAFDGDTVAATLAFARYAKEREPGIEIMSLTDFTNDVVPTSLAVARAMHAEFGPGSLYGVRIDTSENLVDQCLIGDPMTWGRERPTGVNAPLVHKLRAALDDAGFPDVHIVVSGGFNEEKIRRFEDAAVPVGAYGVGEDLITGAHSFTGDIVEVDGTAISKVGRYLTPNERFVRLDWSRIDASA